MGSLRLALLQLRRRPASALLAALSLALVLSSASALFSLQRGLDAGFHAVDPAVDVIIGPKHSPWRLFHGALQYGAWEFDFVRGSTAMTSVEIGTPYRHVMPIARFAHAGPFPVIGVERSFFERPEGVWAPTLATGRLPDADPEVVLGARAARQLGLQPGDSLEIHSDMPHPTTGAPVWSGRAEVVGVLAPSRTFLDDAIFGTVARARISYRSVVEYIPHRHYTRDLYSHLLISLDLDDPAQRVELFETFHTRRAELVVHVDDILADWATLAGRGAEASRLHGLLLLLLAGSLLLLLLRERAESARPREGLLRALGYHRMERWRALLFEGGLLLLLALALMLPLERLLLQGASALVPGLAEGLARIPILHLHHALLAGGALLLLALLTLLPALRRDDPSLLKGL